MKTEEGELLIVDDEPDVCWVLAHLAAKKGFASAVAFTGREALALVAARRFRVIFLDAKLPDMDSFELAGLMKEVDADVRIVLISAFFYGDDTVVRRALEGGLISDFIAKPFDHEQIARVLAGVGHS